MKRPRRLFHALRVSTRDIGRTCATLVGGPCDGTIIFPPRGAVELGLNDGGRAHVYRLDGDQGRYIGTRDYEGYLCETKAGPLEFAKTLQPPRRKRGE
jgi:hypothetical protein